MKFDWVLSKVIYLDVNSDVNSGNNEIGVKFDWVLSKVIYLDVNSDVNSQPFSM